jgi:calcineurin-like phosphoesterase family protein
MALKRGFASAEEHDEHIIEKWNSVVNKKDTVWILGDITMEKSSPFHLLDRLKGIKNVILGNHDMPQHVPEMLKHVNKVCSTIKKKNVILTHIPIHTQEIGRFRKNIHGHLHENKVMIDTHDTFGNKNGETEDDRFINVSCECVDFTPVELNSLI